MTMFGRVTLAVAAVAVMFLTIAAWATGPSLGLLGPLHYMTLIPPLAGFALWAGDWRSQGAHDLFAAGMILAAVTVLMGLVVGATGLRMLFNLLSSDEAAADAVRFRQIMASGIVEALSLFQRYATMAALQILLWANLRVWRTVQAPQLGGR